MQTVYEFGTLALRVQNMDGEPWVAAADLAKLAGGFDAAAFCRKLSPDQRRKAPAATKSGRQQLLLVNEIGARTLFADHVTDAVKWLFHTVFPAARAGLSSPAVPSSGRGSLLYAKGDVVRCEAGHPVAAILANVGVDDLLVLSSYQLEPAYATRPDWCQCGAFIPWWKGTAVVPGQCRVPGCRGPAPSRGARLCRMHYRLQLSGRPLDSILKTGRPPKKG